MGRDNINIELFKYASPVIKKVFLKQVNKCCTENHTRGVETSCYSNYFIKDK